MEQKLKIPRSKRNKQGKERDFKAQQRNIKEICETPSKEQIFEFQSQKRENPMTMALTRSEKIFTNKGKTYIDTRSTQNPN